MDKYKTLEEIGFSANEAKVYLTLLEHGAMNGYNAAKYSGVARAIVYDVLNRLAMKKCVDIIEAEPKLYAAVEYDRLIKEIKDDYNEKIISAEKMLSQTASKNIEKQYVVNISDFELLIGEAKRLIDTAQNTLYLSLWSEDAILLRENLKKAHARGVKIYVFSYCKMPFSFGIQYTYNITDAENLFPTRRLIVIADCAEMLLCESGQNAQQVGVVTKNTMLIKLSIDQIVLDIFNCYSLKSDGLNSKELTASQFIKASDAHSKKIGLPADIPSNSDVAAFLIKARENK